MSWRTDLLVYAREWRSCTEPGWNGAAGSWRAGYARTIRPLQAEGGLSTNPEHPNYSSWADIAESLAYDGRKGGRS